MAAGAEISEIQLLLSFYHALGFESLPFALQGEGGAGMVSDRGEKGSRLTQLREHIGDCRRCKLSAHRSNLVFGAGNPDAKLMFIGEAPGKEEDLRGLPFVGDAGMLLTRLITKMGMEREEVYIANIIKCRPPMNRDPEDDEIAACRGFVEKQIEIIRPRIIITLGRIALQALMKMPKVRISSARGQFHDYEGIPVMPTFHPAYLLRNPRDKVLTWADAQKVMSKLAASPREDCL